MPDQWLNIPRWRPECPPGLWTSEDSRMFAGLALLCEEDDVFVEVGVFLGGLVSTISPILMKAKAKYVAVDHFQGDGNECLDSTMTQVYKLVLMGPMVRQTFEANMRILGLWDWLELLEMPSVVAAQHFDDESVTVCFLDGDHSVEAVTDDIAAWWPKVKQRGAMGGHDWLTGSCGVREAVMKWLDKTPLSLVTSSNCWAVQKVACDSVRESVLG